MGLTAGLALAASPAAAHVTIAAKGVKAGQTATFVLKIPHGCAGAETTGLRVAMPGVLSDIAPQDKAGWSAVVTPAAGDVGASAKRAQIAWTGGTIPAADHAEFVFTAKVAADAKGRIYVPIVQQCGDALERWIEIPASPAAGEPDKPAPAFEVKP
ncbi:DUF1775 domain-containing protein [Rhizobium sp. 9140]|uniref:DUF1775 domain-containing protein n=1 Tax=Rhizobium sp. 9140 TaxID=1761900 RepID=UPI001586818E|nr:DUF1775 domain-containing protein [Rhizobium sp. 9140]